MLPNGNTVEQVGMVTTIYDAPLNISGDDSAIKDMLCHEFDHSVSRHPDFVRLVSDPVIERYRLKWVEGYFRDDDGTTYDGFVQCAEDDPDASAWQYLVAAQAERARRLQ